MTANRKMFTIPTYSASKDEELNFLCKLEKELGPNTYLASLINPDLITWFRHQMRDDVSCNIAEFVNHLQKEHMAIVGEVNRLNGIINQARTDLENERAYRANSDTRWEESLDQRDNRINDLVERNEQLQDYLTADSDKLAENGHRIAALESEITNLKARLYDLMTSQK